MTDPLEMLTKKKLAKLLGLCPHRLDIWRREGRGPRWVKFGASKTSPVRYRRCDVEAWIDSHGTSDSGQTRPTLGELPESPAPVCVNKGRSCHGCRHHTQEAVA